MVRAPTDGSLAFCAEDSLASCVDRSLTSCAEDSLAFCAEDSLTFCVDGGARRTLAAGVGCACAFVSCHALCVGSRGLIAVRAARSCV